MHTKEKPNNRAIHLTALKVPTWCVYNLQLVTPWWNTILNSASWEKTFEYFMTAFLWKALNLFYLWLICVGDFISKNSIKIADPKPSMDIICKVERFMVSLYDTLGIIYLRVCQNKSGTDLGYYSISQW